MEGIGRWTAWRHLPVPAVPETVIRKGSGCSACTWLRTALYTSCCLPCKRSGTAVEVATTHRGELDTRKWLIAANRAQYTDWIDAAQLYPNLQKAPCFVKHAKENAQLQYPLFTWQARTGTLFSRNLVISRASTTKPGRSGCCYVPMCSEWRISLTFWNERQQAYPVPLKLACWFVLAQAVFP